MAEANLVVFITGRGGDLIKEFKKVGKAADSEGGTVTKGWSKAAKGTVAAAGLIGGTALALGGEAIHMADSFEEAHARLEGAIKSTGESMSKLSGPVTTVDKQLESLGFTNTDTEASLSILTRASGSAQKALELMGLAANVARGRNISLGDATNILAKVETGHVALLGRLGINTKDAEGKTISQTEAIRRLSAMFKDQASISAQTFAGKQKILGAQLEDVGIKIGVAVMPALSKMADFLVNDVIPAIAATVNWVEKNWPKVQKVITETVQKIEPVIRDVLGAIEAFWRNWGGQIAMIARLAFAGVASLIRGAMLVIRGIINVVMGLIHGDWSQAWNGLKEVFAGVWDSIVGLVKVAAAAIMTVVQPIIDAIKWVADHVDSLIHNAGKGKDVPKGYKDVGGKLVPISVAGGRAAGGSVGPFKTYMVGERGPELLTMGSRAGTITPNNAWSGGSASVIYNVEISGPVYGVRDLKTQIIDALREETAKNGSISRVRVSG